MTKRVSGLTLIEVIIGMLLLAVLAAVLLSFLPRLTQNTQASSVDTGQSQTAIAVFEEIAAAWTNVGAWQTSSVGGQTVTQLVSDRLGDACSVDVSTIDTTRKRVTITCAATDNLPERSLRAEFGDPGA